jgi:hypothetical protein
MGALSRYVPVCGGAAAADEAGMSHLGELFHSGRGEEGVQVRARPTPASRTDAMCTHLWLQAPSRTVAGCSTYGCRLHHVRLQVSGANAGFVGAMCWPSVHVAGAFCTGLTADTQFEGTITQMSGRQEIVQIEP